MARPEKEAAVQEIVETLDKAKSVSGPGPRTTSKTKFASGEKVTDDRPFYVLSIEDGLTRPCTGRFSNDYIESGNIIHWTSRLLHYRSLHFLWLFRLCLNNSLIGNNFNRHFLRGVSHESVNPEPG